MPPVVAFLAPVLLTAEGAAIVSVASVIGSVALSAISSALAPHQSAGTPTAPQPLSFAMRGTEDRSWVYGRTALTGWVIYP